MKHVKKSVLLWYSPQEMYALVTDVARYPEFLPWCDKAEVLTEHDDGVTARLGLAFKGLRHAFTTRNVHHEPDRVSVDLVDGPFSHLQGLWLFKSLGAESSTQQACKVELDLRYEFAGAALDALLGPVFDKVANSLVDAFVQRAEVVYGAR